MRVLLTDDRRPLAEVSRMDNTVDRLHEAIKTFVTNLTRESLEEQDGHRAMEIIAFAINLEHIGDIIDKNLMELAAKKIKHKYAFSKEGAQELEAFHARVVNNLKLAFSIFMAGDVKLARRLIQDKAEIRKEELAAAENHLRRLREGRPGADASTRVCIVCHHRRTMSATNPFLTNRRQGGCFPPPRMFCPIHD
jgi:phosphate:Na+ symporter